MNKVTKVIIISFLTNISLSVMQIIAGILGRAGAIVADGIHSLSDTTTDIFALIGSKISRKPADYKHPLGHGKAEYITCAFISLVVLFMGIMVIYNGIFDKRSIPNSYVAIVTVIAIIIKYILSQFLINRGKKYQSNILVASGTESFSDVLSSVVVLVSVLLSQLGHYYYIFTYADALAMIIVGALIIKIGIKLLIENISNLMDTRVTDINYINEIKKVVSNFKEIENIDNLIILKEGPFYKVDLEVSLNKNMKLINVHNILEEIEDKIREYDNNIQYIIIHPNPYKGD